uniref:SPARC-related modular calcium-binding protein 1-like n=1 Tax=Paramormyrops kingsleyae TaxID=1676925 RepID=A0A3B3S2P2_9TELE|nr:SPARC-related modular calcium-binding protein 1-like isoform X1 [Paramormyrops kingsleyae]XP_023667892.1 SPARC-related modular calcium-binding protein 1-like isoform X1 [Paramormyrops kingsleyae]
MLARKICGLLLLLIVISASPLMADKSSLLISESMWPHGCVLNCARGRHRAVCGSNGQLYKSQCAFQRAQCGNLQLKKAPHAHCAAAREPERTKDQVKSKCQLARDKALESVTSSNTTTFFVPECSEEGTYLQVQCHSQTGYCWCSTPDGKLVSGTSVLHQRPNCTSQVPETFMMHVQHKEGSRVSPTPDPSLSDSSSSAVSEITAPPFWVTILLNSDPKGNRHVRPPAETPRPCERERAALLAAAAPPRLNEERYVPECSADGRYSPVQCHAAAGYCWCVWVDTGRLVRGTSVRNQLPDCSKEQKQAGHRDKGYKDKPLPGCPGARKKELLQGLVRTLQLEALQAGDAPSSQWRVDVPLSSPVPESFSPSPQDRAVSVRGGAGGVLQEYFLALDVNGDGGLSEQEERPLRHLLRHLLRRLQPRLQPRRCAKRFTQHCDGDGDRSLTLAELAGCLGL